MEDDELDDALRALTPRQGPPALDEARVFGTAPPRRSPWRLAAMVAVPLALAAGALWTVRAPSPEPPDELGTRGQGATDAPHVELRLYQDGPTPTRLTRGAAVNVGSTVLFEIAADSPATVRVWAEDGAGDRAETALATLRVGADPVMLPAGAALLSWTFDHPGRVAFHASSGAGCDPARCDTWEVEAR